MNYHTVKQIACELVKSISDISQALAALSEEMAQVREATLENQAVIDYLRLRHNHGCEEFKGMCCFNLSNNS